jgi:DNA polymerase-3 subunit gamma/tau
VSYTVFARKYRPQTFDDVVGQEHITRTLKNAIEQNRLAHAYIFVGPRGTGKTSTARILAKALNCINGPTITPCGVCDVCREIAAGNSLNVLEFDAASNTQVDKIRELIIENVKYAPTRGKYKLYIVDEVHMLSNSSFNALLKTLEEPPEHVKFVFATTDVQKVPTTILSRCQRFDLKRIPTALIARHLLGIAEKEQLTLTVAAAETIARGAEGGMRDAESMLDQLVAFCGESIDEPDVLSVFGFTSRQTVATICDQLIAGDASAALSTVHEQAEAGRDLSRFMADLITHLRNLLVAKADPKGVRDELCEESLAELTEQAARVEMSKLLDLIEQFAAAEGRMKWAPNKKMHFEIAVIRAIQTLSQSTLDEVLETLAALRRGESPPAKTPKAAPLPPRLKAEQKVQPPAPARAPAPVKAAAPVPEAPKAEPAPEPPADTATPAPAIREEAAPPPAQSTLSDKGDFWPAFVQEVRQRRKLISAWVEGGALLRIEGDLVELGFPTDQKFAMDFLQKSHRAFLEEIATQLLGRSIEMKFELKEGLVPAPPPPPIESTPPPAADPGVDFRNDPLIRRALELFKAEIQPA